MSLAWLCDLTVIELGTVLMPMMMCNLGAEAVESDDDADASLTWKWIWPIYGRYKVMFLFRRNPAVPSHHPPPATANKIRPAKVHYTILFTRRNIDRADCPEITAFISGHHI